MSGYFDLRRDLFRTAFASALPYPDYLATGNARERRLGAGRGGDTGTLPDGAEARLDPAERVVKLLCLGGIWCGDCVRSVPIPKGERP